MKPWMRRTVIGMLAVLAATMTIVGVAFVARYAMRKGRGMTDSIGTPLFVIDNLRVDRSRLSLVGALQVNSASQDAITCGDFHELSGKFVLFCGDRLLSEKLKVLHEGSISIADPSLVNDPVAQGLREIAHPIDIAEDAVVIFQIGADGQIVRRITGQFTQVMFTYE